MRHRHQAAHRGDPQGEQACTIALAEAYEQGPDTYLAAPDPESASAGHGPFLAVEPLIDRGWQIVRPR